MHTLVHILNRMVIIIEDKKAIPSGRVFPLGLLIYISRLQLIVYHNFVDMSTV